ELTLTNLDAGDYQLEIKATNADLQWSENTAKIEFTLLPKPWLTWWAKVFYSMVATCIAWLIFRLYHSKLLTQYALEHREVQLSQAIWGSGDELWEWDIRKHEIIRTNNAELDDDRRRYFNGSFASSTLNIHPSDVEKLQTKIQSILAGETDEFDAVYRQKNKQGKWQWMQDRAKVTAWSNDRKPLTINGISRNINTIKEKEEKSQLIASAFQSSSDGALVLDADLRIISINTAFTKITGYDERVINTTLQKNSDRISADDMDSLTLFNHIKSGIFTTGSYRNEILIQTLGGNKLPIDLRVNCIYNAQKNPSHYIVTLTDITYRKNTEEALKKLANYDNLTGLPNRSLMMIQLNQALLQADRNDKHMAIMFVDLDHFKNINDSLGHTIGDELLIAVANRLTQCVRKSDTIARIGGDEFTIGILSYEHINDVINVAKKVLEHMSEPFQLENHELIITPSIGIATTNGTQTDIETLLMQADTAMYHAKKRGRNNFRFFTESMNQAVLQRVDIEMRLRKALQNNELLLHYQPKYNLATGVVSGFEALLRWQDANQVLTPPDEFIPIAEETGLIFSIGEFVLESACQELKKWHENGFKDIHVAINLSAIQFIDKKLALVVGKILEKYKIPPLSLEIEITESTLIENLEYAIKTLHELRDLGVKLSLDDFGTGFSSLNYLKQFPIHALKIDRTFIRDMVNDSRDASMVDSIVSLAHNLSIEVIAEGVESIEQLELLASYNIEEAQGYLLSKPVDSDTVTEILNQGQTITHILAGLKGK
ncbi:MAG: EAL domain-containing protein, partial [Marinicella sp.]